MSRWTCPSISSRVFSRHRKLLCLTTILLTIFLIVAYIPQDGLYHYSPYNWLLGNGEPLVVADKCGAKHNIVFIKTHKCASSAIQNILMRYGVANGEVFVLPAKDNYLGHPQPFHRSFVPDPNRFHHEYNILAHHSRLNYAEMSALMPNDTLFITILRNPVDLFESMFTYYGLQQFWNITLDSLTIAEKVSKTRLVDKIGINQMMFDLGVSPTEFTKQNVVRQHINHFDSIFDLVMLAERMDESLVLLKHLMCWSTDDVVVFKVWLAFYNHYSNKCGKYLYTQLNARESKSNLSDATRSRLAALNWADSELYKHFERKFAKIVGDFGEQRMNAELNELRERTKEWFEYCVSENRSSVDMVAKTQVAIVRHINRHRHNSTCWLLTAHEMQLTDYLRDRQSRAFPGSVFGPTVATVHEKNPVPAKRQQQRKPYSFRINPKYAGLWCKRCFNNNTVKQVRGCVNFSANYYKHLCLE